MTLATYDFLCALVVDDAGRTWAETGTDYQRARVRAILDESPEAISQHAVIEPKGSRKTSDAAALAFSIMLTRAPTGSRLYGAAADLEQAALLVDSFRELRDRTPGLDGIAVTESKVVIPWRNVEFEALPADSAGAQGLRPYFLVIDELHEWIDTRRVRRFLSNLLAGHDKAHRVDPLARLVVQSNAGSPTSLAGRHFAMARKSRFWAVHELVTADGITSPLPWVTAEDLEKAREKADTDAEFRRLHLGEWVQGPDRLATLEDVEACAVLDGDLPPAYGMRYLISADLASQRDMSVLSVLHLGHGSEGGSAAVDGERAGGPTARLVVDALRVWRRGRDEPPIDLMEVAAEAVDLARDYGAPLVTDQWGHVMVQHLWQHGVKAWVETATQASNSRQVVGLMNLLQDRRVELPRDPDLIRELATVPVVETAPGFYKLGDDRNSDDGHHDRTSAIALGAFVLEKAVMDAGQAAQRRRAPVVLTGAQDYRRSQLAALYQPLARSGDQRAIAWLRAHPAPDVLIGSRIMPANRRR